MTLHDLSPEQLAKFQVLYNKEEKTLLIAYLLLIFAGGLGAHELYTKDTSWFKLRWAFTILLVVGMGLAALTAAFDSIVLAVIFSILSFIGIVGLVVVSFKTVVDFFTMPKKLSAVNQRTEDEIIVELKGKVAEDFMASSNPEETNEETAPIETEESSVIEEISTPEVTVVDTLKPETTFEPEVIVDTPKIPEIPEVKVENEPIVPKSPVAPIVEEVTTVDKTPIVEKINPVEPVIPEPTFEPEVIVDTPNIPVMPEVKVESEPFAPKSPVAPIVEEVTTVDKTPIEKITSAEPVVDHSVMPPLNLDLNSNTASTLDNPTMPELKMEPPTVKPILNDAPNNPIDPASESPQNPIHGVG